MTEMKNRVYGAIGIKSIMSNWNADFTGFPKTTSDGNIFGSDKALKYPMKQMWKAEGENVMYTKTLKEGGSQPKNLLERYEELYKKIEKKDTKKTISNLFNAIDVMNFGATFAESEQNISITGVVQIGQGMNKYEDAEPQIQDILSPFQNSNKKDSNQSSLGKKIVVDEAHYLYPFSVNPTNYDYYKNIGLENFIGYTVEAYNKFKKAALYSATAFNTNSKVGCENEFAIFITCKENSEIYLANVDTYINFIKDEKIIFDISNLIEMIKNKSDQIEKIEIYINKINTEVKNTTENTINIEIVDLYTDEKLSFASGN